ncbi:MAG: MFS transporter [Roseitalea sp.]|nr:MFS transporter [Roseitalea sp.]MBO6953779.1 MFS transporter [Rhizobiaceae bacterium]MBO6594127.1 MFS transporter [Roseitalea sp.]MBO6601440.1 MFS transporter [Roseitalea sp.]MBO6613530.1 MFS transporter [Roseitalea sp.]
MSGDMDRSARYTLLVLAAILAVNHLDRHILSITLNQIGAEFALTDTQLGLLSGLLFAVVYVLFGFPVAKLAATGNRRNIVAISAAVWSTLTIAMAGAQNFAQLALARLGVGIGEAGAVAPSHSMISDLYPEHRRTSAMAAYVAGANIGVLLAFLVGGIVGQAFGWRWAFVVAGIPGLVLALLLRFTVAEPQRERPVSADQSRSLFLSTFGTIWNDRGLFHAMAGISIVGIVTFGALAWNPTFIIRVHGLSQAQTGIFLALTIGIGGGLGTWLSGRLADRWGDADPRWRIGIVVAVILISKPFIAVFLLADGRALALAAFVGSAAIASVFWGPTFAYLHSRIEPHMRPMATAIFLFCFNLIGVGVGPTIIGFLSDAVFAASGARSVAHALLAVQIAGIWAAWHYWQVVKEIARVPAQTSSAGKAA